ncbi:NmrA family NAD(P)-binding protein [Sphingomonas sp. QA11]|uniref:SDR family oxidoreductase n=1 Tax=Sphingomonas sp. QA11 TaxID=2950605 RepID=UPI00234A2279|nr:NmrA family NAD(P)-binding protein [Sphingomonas sp. QA11]WCM29453.1 NmrA family NAD(P)-binding protein [Sphingomonas sp. QA11]
MSAINSSSPILVYLANGVQGGAVVRAALRRGLKVRALVRDRERARALAVPGVDIVEGDLRDSSSLRMASAGVAHAVLQIPIGSQDEMRAAAENALSASIACGLRSFILRLASASRPVPCPEPSFVANAMVEDMVRRSGMPFAVVRPTLYLDNLLKPSARREIVRHGVFAPPIAESQPIAWTSVDDCAEAALTLLERGAYGGDHRIAGPESVTGEELALRVSAGLGRRIVYRAQSLDEFEGEIDAAMGPGTGRLVASRFRFFAAHRDEAETMLSGSLVPQPGLEDFQPTGVEAWVRRHKEDFQDDSPASIRER